MNWNIFKMGNAILNYHKISPDNNSSKENDELSVSESKFRQQLIFLKKNYNLVSLNNLINFEKSNKFNICITFDDGYKDNLTYALPILKELNVPATIYFVTKFFENEFSIWWRELEDYIWQNSGNIKFEYEKKKYDISIKDNSEKIRCYGKLVQIIKRLDKIEQEKFSQLRKRLK